MKKLFIILLAVGIAGWSVFGWNAYQIYRKSQPEYMLALLREALIDKDVERARTYMNADEIFDNIWDAMMAKNKKIAETSGGSGFEALAVGLADFFKPLAKEIFLTKIDEAISSGMNDSGLVSEIKNPGKFIVKKSGDAASTDMGDLTIRMRKENNVWKIIALDVEPGSDLEKNFEKQLKEEPLDSSGQKMPN